MKSSIIEQKLAAISAHAPLDRRFAERVSIHFRVTYTFKEGARLIRTDGSLKDLSKTGCKILGSMLPAAGESLTVTLHLEDGPLRLTDATVSWIKGSVFAVRFPKLTEHERKRIQGVIWKYVTFSSPNNHRAAFRIV